MKWQAALDAKSFEIVKTPFYNPDGSFYSFHYYIFAYKDSKCTHIYLQDSFKLALLCALKDLAVPKEAWIKVKN